MAQTFLGRWLVTPYMQPNGVFVMRTTELDGGHPCERCDVPWPDEKIGAVADRCAELLSLPRRLRSPS